MALKKKLRKMRQIKTFLESEKKYQHSPLVCRPSHVLGYRGGLRVFLGSIVGCHLVLGRKLVAAFLDPITDISHGNSKLFREDSWGHAVIDNPLHHGIRLFRRVVSATGRKTRGWGIKYE